MKNLHNLPSWSLGPCGSVLPFSSTCPTFSSFSGFLLVCGVCLLKLKFAPCAPWPLPSASSSSASASITKQLPLINLFYWFFFYFFKYTPSPFSVQGDNSNQTKKKKSTKPSEENRIDPVYHSESYLGTGQQIKFGLVVLRSDARLLPISSFSILGTKMNSVCSANHFVPQRLWGKKVNFIFIVFSVPRIITLKKGITLAASFM